MKMDELDSEEKIKNTVQDTQILIRNCMEKHKKESKTMHTQIKKKKKTIDLFQEKIAKLMAEKDKLESKNQDLTADNKEGDSESKKIQSLKDAIQKELEKKKDMNQQIKDIKKDFVSVRKNMGHDMGRIGGINAIKYQKDKYEKHIISLENRLAKANQKFNESIEYDKNLRTEIDKLRKERFFFENIYKKLERELENVRKEISDCLAAAYENYEGRDKKQEEFESLKANLEKIKGEYLNLCREMSNKTSKNENIKKPEQSEHNNSKTENLTSLNAKPYMKSKKNDGSDTLTEKKEEYKELKYKFEKLAEFTGDKSLSDLSLAGKEIDLFSKKEVPEEYRKIKEEIEKMAEETGIEELKKLDPNDGVLLFCKNFIKEDKENYDNFKVISNLSTTVKEIEAEIKEIKQEIDFLQGEKDLGSKCADNKLVSMLTEKTQKLVIQKDKYEAEFKKNQDEFQDLKFYILQIFKNLQCILKMDKQQRVEYFGEDPKLEIKIREENKYRDITEEEIEQKINEAILEEKYKIEDENGNESQGNGLTEENVREFLSKIEISMKEQLKMLEDEKKPTNDTISKVQKETTEQRLGKWEETMNMAYAEIENLKNKSKTLDRIKENKPGQTPIRLEDAGKDLADELDKKIEIVEESKKLEKKGKNLTKKFLPNISGAMPA